jgi:hypothetical protein
MDRMEEYLEHSINVSDADPSSYHTNPKISLICDADHIEDREYLYDCLEKLSAKYICPNNFDIIMSYIRDKHPQLNDINIIIDNIWFLQFKIHKTSGQCDKNVTKNADNLWLYYNREEFNKKVDEMAGGNGEQTTKNKLHYLLVNSVCLGFTCKLLIFAIFSYAFGYSSLFFLKKGKIIDSNTYDMILNIFLIFTSLAIAYLNLV